MSDDTPVLGIPALRSNPFQARPLEKGMSNLLVGREETSARWTRFIKARNARMILLIGESGSGRSSLMRCVSEETTKSVHLDMFPSADHVNKILHEIFVSFVGFEVPSSTPEMVSRLVLETEKIEGPLPLISLDYANVDGKKLSEILSTLVAALERLNALVVVVLSTEQRAQWPNNLVNRFDHADIIGSLEKLQVKNLCESRMATSSNLSWDMPDDALEYVMEKTSGSPSKIMRLMRDLVDEERANPREVKYDQTAEEQIDVIFETEVNSDEEDVEDNIGIAFDLDLDELEKEPESIYMEASETIPLPSTGPFSALAARNRGNKHLSPRFDKTKAKNPVREPVGVDANQLWISDEPDAVLIQENEDLIEPEQPGDMVQNFSENYQQPTIQANSNDEVEGLVNQLLTALNVPEGLGFADLLAAMRRPVIGLRESNALDVYTLRSLSKSEAVLVEVSSSREFSPSDNRLQDRLNVGRPRMSQMCNRLYRAGILSVQQRGRSRMFKLTNDARAQLVAWGMMEAVV